MSYTHPDYANGRRMVDSSRTGPSFAAELPGDLPSTTPYSSNAVTAHLAPKAGVVDNYGGYARATLVSEQQTSVPPQARLDGPPAAVPVWRYNITQAWSNQHEGLESAQRIQPGASSMERAGSTGTLPSTHNTEWFPQPQAQPQLGVDAAHLPRPDRAVEAIQYQQHALASVSQPSSSENLRRSHSNSPYGSRHFTRKPHPRSRVEEQIRLDEEFARKLSIEEMQRAGVVNDQSPRGLNVHVHSSDDGQSMRDEYRRHDEQWLQQSQSRSRPQHSPSPTRTAFASSTAYPPAPLSEFPGYTHSEMPPSAIHHSSERVDDRASTPVFNDNPSEASMNMDVPSFEYTPPSSPQYPDRPAPPSPGERFRHERSNSLELPLSRAEQCRTPVECRAMCHQCEEERDNVSFCPVCSINYCRMHWDQQPLHRQTTQQRSLTGVPHEKTDPELAEKILSIIEPPVSEREQEQLHKNDESTTWFGVQVDHGGQLYFHDWGRYEEFLAQANIAQTKMRTTSVQYPSLVSFVGPTGAGKSTIVKALVKLFQKTSDGNNPQTPVVGLAEHHSVPTSGEVHLYWEPRSLFSQRPLLYADCEGLGAGSREPMSERAVSGEKEKEKDRKVATKDRKEKPARPRKPSNESYQPEYSSSPQWRPYSNRASWISPSPPPMHHHSPPSHLSTTPNYLTPTSLSIDASASLPSAGYSPYSPIESPPADDKGWRPGCAKSQRGFTHPIEWANGHRRNRQFIVENLYPRILYTFSDVVVLVLRNAKQLEGEIQRLIEWAATAIEKSSNQPVLPFAIIVINAVDNRVKEEMLQVSHATTQLLDELEHAVHKNPVFMKWAQFWRNNDRHIDTTKDLLLSYYSDVRIVLVPEKGRPKKVHAQYRALRNEILNAVDRSQKRRQTARLLLTSHQFNPYLQIAYQHFSQTLDRPFDFIQASYAFSKSIHENNAILALIRTAPMDQSSRSCRAILKNLAPLVASSIMLDAVRRQLPGNTNAILPAYEGKIKEALKVFLDESWPCEALHPKLGERCIVVRTTHETKGHQLVNGKMWGGAYCSSESPNKVEEGFLTEVYELVRKLYRLIMSIEEKHGISGASEEQTIAFDIHTKSVIPKHCKFFQQGKQLINHVICLCCLFRIPMYPLLCGHIICDECFIAAAGSNQHEKIIYRLYGCPICLQSWHAKRPPYVEITIAPAETGVRVLTLDGGGVRAIIELTVLSMIEERIAFGIPIQDFFDLIVGTSGGGIVALALGEKNMRVEEATKMFKHFAWSAFQARKGVNLPLGLGKLIRLKYQSRYESKGLEECLKNTFGQELLFGGERHSQSPSHCRVAVTATDTNGEARLLANYNRMQRTKSLYTFQRFERPEQELSAWETARATAAAPGFFKGYFKSSNGHTYWDGALKLNNPVFGAEDERHNIWPEKSSSLPDIVLSLGTGHFPDVRSGSSDPGPRFEINIVDGVKAFVQIGRDAIASGLDCERIWQEYHRSTVQGDAEKEGRFHRLNMPIRGNKIELDDVMSMAELEDMTKRHYSSADKTSINEISSRLIASLFYFEMARFIRSTVYGTIKCRLAPSEAPNSSLKRLASGIRRMKPHSCYFRIFPNTQSQVWKQVPLRFEMLEAVLYKHDSFEIPIEFDLTDESVSSSILLCLDRPNFKPQAISGLPRIMKTRDTLSPIPSHSPSSTPRLSHRSTSSIDSTTAAATPLASFAERAAGIGGMHGSFDFLNDKDT